jgi:hypothetical protein
MAGEKELRLRHELKYRIDSLQHQVLQRKLSVVLKPDPHMATTKKYVVKNLYFDDFQNSAFSEKESGVPNRKKYRIRTYNHSDAVIKFERKTKLNQYILKESTRVTRIEAERIINGDCQFLASAQNSLLRDFYREGRCKLMRPVVIVEYDREAYVHPVGNVRITLDTGLRTGLGSTGFFDEFCTTMSIPNAQGTVLEVKYDKVLPQFICGLFPDSIRPRSSFGKYAICRAHQRCQAGNSFSGFSCVKTDKACSTSKIPEIDV